MVRLTLGLLGLAGGLWGQVEMASSVDGTAQAFTVTQATQPLVTASYVYWGKDWAFASVGKAVTALGENRYSYRVTAANLKLTGTGGAEPVAGGMRFRWNWAAEAEVNPANGGGLEFVLAQSAGLPGAAAPELLEGGLGWRWQFGEGQALEVRFEAPPARVYFEQGNRYRIRAFFYEGLIAGGTREAAMTVALPEGARVVPSTLERYGPEDDAKWFTRALDLNESFVDLSYLNASHMPAGRHGPVAVQGDRLVFPTGEEARFWGVNIQASSLFNPDRATIDRQARRLAKLGFNLARLHHHDSAGWVNPSLIDVSGATTEGINERALDTYFYWVKALRENGIYLWIDLYTGRTFKPGDGIAGFEELYPKDTSANKDARGIAVKGYHYGSARMTELIRKFNRELMTRVNPHTGVALKDDAAVVAVLLANENDLANHFGNSFLADKGVPSFNALFNEKTAAWAAERGLPVSEVRQTWVPGVSKLFLNDWEHEWCAGTAAELRALGVKAPIVYGHQWGNNPLFNLPVVAAGDVVDVHAYESGEFVTKNPRYGDHALSYVAASQVVDKPLSVTEYNAGSNSVKDPFTVPLATAAMGALQGWDALMLYGYSQDAFRVSTADVWSSHNNPAILGLMPAAAMLYRAGHVSAAVSTVVVRLDRQRAFLESWTPRNSRTLRTLAEQYRLAIGLPDAPELAWDRASEERPEVYETTEMEADFVGAERTWVESDTGEIRRDWEKGIQTIRTARSAAAVGWLKGEVVEAGAVTVEVETAKAAVAVTSMDERPLEESGLMLISTAARVKAAPPNGFKSEPVAGRLTIRSNQPRLVLAPLNADGTEQEAIPLEREGEGYAFRLPVDRNTHWFLLRAR